MICDSYYSCMKTTGKWISWQVQACKSSKNVEKITVKLDSEIKYWSQFEIEPKIQSPKLPIKPTVSIKA